MSICVKILQNVHIQIGLPVVHTSTRLLVFFLRELCTGTQRTKASDAHGCTV